jgi:hypothetical protein
MSRIFRRLLPALGLALLIAGPAEAKKKEGEGVPVKVQVSDEAGEPIATAVVRHPDEADRHRVNAVDGSWEAAVLYMPDGTELVFAPGLTLKLEVSAPGYMTQVLQYDVRKRNNKIQITLSKLELESEEIEEPVIQFGRDRPREDNSGAPAN